MAHYDDRPESLAPPRTKMAAHSPLETSDAEADDHSMIRRHPQTLVEEPLADIPAVAVLGPPSVGKSMLAQMLSSTRWPALYLTLDETALQEGARA